MAEISSEDQPHHVDLPDEPEPKEHNRNGTDKDAQEMVISSLRDQIQDLFSQVTQLNSKLVKSYDRVSDLEDELHVASSNIRSSSLKISQLELERAQHLSALNTGLLVEKSHVTAELSRLMERATEEAAQRGQAETARADIEKELDDLSANLFDQANTMVAEARFARHMSERKLEEAESALKVAEEAVGLMQQQMQELHSDKQDAEKKALEMQVAMGKGKWNPNQDVFKIPQNLRLLSSHLPYQEFLLFVAHLRTLHQTSPNPPATPTLLPLPFLGRLSNEDSEPTLRLDLAPSLNWLSRRSVLSAIHTGQLTIEPMSLVSYMQHESIQPTNPADINGDNILCALCGTSVFSSVPGSSISRSSRPLLNQMSRNSTNGSWSTSLFKRLPTNGRSSIIDSQPPSRQHSPSRGMFASQPQQIFVFRVVSQSASTVVSSIAVPSLSKSSSQVATTHGSTQSHTHINGTISTSPQTQSTTMYPLCANGWCLSRLRTTCTLWAFVRAGLVEKIWDEEIAIPPPQMSVPPSPSGQKPPIPPRKRGIWGIASALGEKAASWNDSEKDKTKKAPQPPPTPPAPPPRRLPPLPPPQPKSDLSGEKHPPAPVAPSSAPPPLPKRSQGRTRTPVETHATSEDEVTADAQAAETIHDQIRPTEESEATPVAPPIPPRARGPAPTVQVLQISESQDASEDKAKVHSEIEPISQPPPSSMPSTPSPPQLHRTPPPRLSTPSQVPLPDSRPGSPPVLSQPQIVPATPPPPLPRRAAARGARPMSTFVDGGSRPTTPASPAVQPTTRTSIDIPAVPINPPTVEDPKTDELKLEGATTSEKEDRKDNAEDSDDSKPENVESAHVNGRTDEGDGGKHKPVSMRSPSSEDVFVDAPSPGQEIEEPATSIEKSSEIMERQNEEDNNLDATLADEKTVNGDYEADDKGSTSEDGGETYIGTVTWEERTWKELVRLKEDMFWARIGGLR